MYGCFSAGPLGKRTPVKADVVVKPAMDDITEALRRSPGHPLASHLMIHLTEGGTPGPGLPAVPGNAGKRHYLDMRPEDSAPLNLHCVALPCCRPLAHHTCLCCQGTMTSPAVVIPVSAAMGESAADSLAFNHPYTSMGHLMHMPGHNFIRMGRWHDAVTTNQAALRADEAGIKR